MREGHAPESIHLVGNTMIDTLSKHEAAAQKRAIRWELGLPPGGYLLANLHQPAHVDDPEKLRAILRALAETPLPVVFPLHPRTEKTARDAGLSNLLDKAGATRTLDYLDFLSLQMSAAVVLTYSGAVQEETTALEVACLTLRENTERPVTISHGTNRLIGVDPARILHELQRALEEPPSPRVGPPMWDGQSGERIVAVLDRLF
ncbi:MAG: UDP-N-acetylglucosamine 2-epimerase [Actinomycetota bacterium]|nr:UDP-N-acetylglucosamine 2-epimerase [Actinomycetota bacterium]